MQTYLFSPGADFCRWLSRLFKHNSGRPPLLLSFSEKLRSYLLSYYKQEGEGGNMEYICSQPESSGMHKCGDLPPYVSNGRECAGSIESGLHNQARMISITDTDAEIFGSVCDLSGKFSYLGWFLVAAEPTTLVEASCLSFFFILSKLKTTAKTGLNCPTKHGSI